MKAIPGVGRPPFRDVGSAIGAAQLAGDVGQRPPTGRSRAVSYSAGCFQAHASIATSLWRPPLPRRRSRDQRRGSARLQLRDTFGGVRLS